MKMLLLLVIVAAFATSCASRDYVIVTEQVADNGLQRIEDKKNSVVCYIYRDNDGNSMQCFNKPKSK